MNIKEAIKKIKNIHQQLEVDTCKKYEISIREANKKPKYIGDFDKKGRLQYNVFKINDAKLMELKGIYFSEEEFDEKVSEIKKKYNIKENIVMHDEGNICIGRGRLTTIGKYKIF